MTVLPHATPRPGSTGPLGAGNASPHPLTSPAVAVVVLATLAAAGLLLLGDFRQLTMGSAVIVWLVACLGGEIFWFKTPGYDSTLSLALTLDVAAVVVLPVSAALCVVGASTILASAVAHRRPFYRVLYNGAQSVMAAGAASLVFRGLANAGGVPESANVPALALMTAGAAFYAVNTVFVAVAVGLSSGRAPWIVWRDCYGHPIEMAATFGQLSLAYFVVLATRTVGPGALLAAFPLLLALWYGSLGEGSTQSSALPD